MSTIKAVIFDIDGVLLDSFEANLKYFQDLLTYTGYAPPSRETYQRMFHLSLRDVLRKLTNASEEEITRLSNIGTSVDFPYDLSLINMPRNSEETLNTLRQRYRLGIVTSRIRSSVYEFPALAKMKGYFAATVAYEDTERHKPDPQPLLLVVQQLGVGPSEAVYIGDAETDITAARAAGMKIILYGEKKHDKADACTQSFETLPSLIESL